MDEAPECHEGASIGMTRASLHGLECSLRSVDNNYLACWDLYQDQLLIQSGRVLNIEISGRDKDRDGSGARSVHFDRNHIATTESERKLGGRCQ